TPGWQLTKHGEGETKINFPTSDKKAEEGEKLFKYHHILDRSMERTNPEDAYSDYVWKVDYIYSHKQRGHQRFFHVKWKQGNTSYISEASLKHHDPLSLVMYATR
ncbi:hypothetical protein, partial [Salmonella enterica]|uniref:hypothetical protein n=1 Tax=Salmonella enterica TaxID=28901 RepID=UPI003525FDBB